MGILIVCILHMLQYAFSTHRTQDILKVCKMYSFSTIKQCNNNNDNDDDNNNNDDVAPINLVFV